MISGREDLTPSLNEVDWPSLHHAYGPATDVPGLLRSLASPNQKEREEARHELCGNLWHQGTIYEATAYAVPYLVRLLQNNCVLDKEHLLVYLSLLFAGRGYWEVHKDLELPHRQSAEVLEKALNQEQVWKERTQSAIREGRDSYLGLLRTGNARERLAAGYLLGRSGRSTAKSSKKFLKRNKHGKSRSHSYDVLQRTREEAL